MLFAYFFMPFKTRLIKISYSALLPSNLFEIIVFLARTYYYRLSVYHILSEEVLKNVFRDLRIYYY